MENTIEDLIASAIVGKPGDFEAAFNDVMLGKVADAIENRKSEIAQTLFTGKEEDGQGNS